MNSTLVHNHGTVKRDIRTGRFVPTFTISYTCDNGRHVRVLPASGINTIGKGLMACADGVAWDVEVLDREGNDVTFDFACFAS